MSVYLTPGAMPSYQLPKAMTPCRLPHGARAIVSFRVLRSVGGAYHAQRERAAKINARADGHHVMGRGVKLLLCLDSTSRPHRRARSLEWRAATRSAVFEDVACPSTAPPR